MLPSIKLPIAAEPEGKALICFAEVQIRSGLDKTSSGGAYEKFRCGIIAGEEVALVFAIK